jgi:hypothetical protein
MGYNGPIVGSYFFPLIYPRGGEIKKIIIF